VRGMPGREVEKGVIPTKGAVQGGEGAATGAQQPLWQDITPTPAGNQHFQLMVDDRSRFMPLVLQLLKDQSVVAIKDFQLRVEAETGEKVGGLRTDRGGEFNSASFLDYCIEHGVKHQLTTPYSPQQNGVVEHRNATVVGTARNMLKAKGLPKWFWGETV
jgi:hypothetical protein